jgi:hypothetical protein
MKISQMYPRRYATGEDFQDKAYTMTIAKITKEKMHPQPGAPEIEKWVIYFQEAKKGVILGRTLAFQIAELLGTEETDEWFGKQVTLYPQPMLVAGKRVIAIRARAAIQELQLAAIPNGLKKP